MFGSGWRSTNHVVPFQNSLLSAYLKGVRKGTLIDDSARPEENDIRRRFLSDEGAAFTLLFLFENGHGLLSSLLAARPVVFAWGIPPRRSFSTQVTAGADLAKRAFSTWNLNRHERLFSAVYLFSAQKKKKRTCQWIGLFSSLRESAGGWWRREPGDYSFF